MHTLHVDVRGGSRAAATSKMERFVIIVNGWKPLTITTKCSILDVAAALDPPLNVENFRDICTLLGAEARNREVIKSMKSILKYSRSEHFN